MGLDLEYQEAQTPLSEDEKEGLLIGTIATRGELDEFEQQNIEEAVAWTLNRSFKPEVVFTEAFIKTLHKKMYGDVWGWAGEFRKSNKNIGVDKWQILTSLRQLLDDATYWHHHQLYSADELSIMFKHRLVSIHCFANGNGRHSRLLADIIIGKMYGLPVYSWGAESLVKSGIQRTNYLNALKAADNGHMQPLIVFARS